MKKAPVHCPNCYKRLFDVQVDPQIKGTVIIKCNRCKTIVSLGLDQYKSIPKASEPQNPKAN